MQKEEHFKLRSVVKIMRGEIIFENSSYEDNYIYVWIYKNRANINTTTLTPFQEKKGHSRSINHRECQHTAYSPTLVVSGCRLSATKAAGHAWPRLSCKENEQLI